MTILAWTTAVFLLYFLADCVQLRPRSAGAKVFYELDSLDRTRPTNLTQVLALPSTHCVPLLGGRSLVVGSSALVCRVPANDALDPTQVSTVVYLGSRGEVGSNGDGGRAFVALDVVEGSALAERLMSTEGVRAVALRKVADSMSVRLGPGEDSDSPSVLALAAGFTTWHRSLVYCPLCAGRTAATRAGAARKCLNPSCGKSHFPRIEPAVIMLVLSSCGNWALLGRKPSWIKGRYSSLAGFVEVGETLEQAVVRECLEESGVDLEPDSVSYYCSQPWPFPSSLMLGFTALAKRTENGALPRINFDSDELEDVIWVSRDQVAKALSVVISESGAGAGASFPPLHFPGISSLARTMLTAWVEEGEEEEGPR